MSGFGKSQKTHRGVEGEEGEMYVGPEGQQVQLSRFRCCDFSCRVQSCFVLNVEVPGGQKVHWKRRSFSLPVDDEDGGFACEVLLRLEVDILLGTPFRRRRVGSLAACA